VGLKAIEENGHVLSVRQSIAGFFKANGQMEPERRGVQTASTFPGFCEKHDASLFRPIEAQKWIENKESAFLLSFRAVSWETYAKRQAEMMSRWQKTWADCGASYEAQVQIQEYLESYIAGVRFGIRDALLWKKEYDDMYKSNDYRRYHYICIEFYPCLPIVACGGIHVESDFQGRVLQKLAAEVSAYEHMTLNITASGDKSIVVFGWAGEPTGPSYEFVRSFLMVPRDRQSHAIIRLAFEHLENTFLRPSWWEALEPDVRNALRHRMSSGAPGQPRPNDCLSEDNLSYFVSTPTTNGIEV
jgi:hypothetical protein